MRGAPVEALAVTASQDRPFVTFTDGQVDRPCGAGDEWDGGGLVALAHDPKCAVAALEAEASMSVAQASLTRSPVEAE
jgi:hypothetical protein